MHAFLAGGGEMGARIRAHDWTSGPLGEPAQWPQSLRAAVSIMLGSSFPTAIYWGPELLLLYNDAWAPIPAERHPRALGRPGAEVWPDIWNVVGPQFAQVIESGVGFSTYDQMLPMVRGGAVAETYWDYSFTPIRAEDGAVAGILNQGNETTGRIIGGRLQSFRLALEERLREAGDPIEVMRIAAELLGGQLGADGVGYAEVEAAERARVDRDWTAPGAATVVGAHRLDDFGPAVAAGLRAGQAVRIGDTADDPLGPAAQAFAALGVRAVVGMPLLRDGRLVAILFVHQATPRRWSDSEMGLILAVAGRTWSAVERARAEGLLRDNEAQLRLATEAAEVGFWDVDEVRQLLTWPPLVKAMFGISADVPVSMGDFYTGLHPDDRDRVGAAYLAAADPARRALYDVEYRTIGKEDGVERWVAAKGRGVFDGDGRCLRVIGTAIDISARRAEAERLRASEAALRETTATLDASIDHAPIGFAFFDRDRRYVRVNDALAAINGVAAADHPGRTVAEIVPHNAAPVLALLDRVFGSGESVPAFEIDGETAAAPGEPRSWLTSFFPIFDRDRGVRFVGVTVIDITDRKRTEAQVRELNEGLEQRVAEALAEKRRLAEVIDRADVFVQVADRDFTWLAINDAAAAEFARIFGVARPRAGDNMLAALDGVPEQRAAVRAVWARALEGEDFVEIAEFGDPGADRRCYEMRFRTLRDAAGAAIGAYQFVSDVTDRINEQARLAAAEAALRQAQKMEAVGQLTGGIAHDFNNLLQGVAGSLDLIRRKPGDTARVERWAEAGLQAAERGAKLTGQLLAFSRAQKIEARPLAVPALLDGMRELLERTLGPAIAVRFDVDIGCGPVLADATQLEMAVLNLAINARDAMPAGGTITVAAYPRTLADDPELGAGDYIELSVADTGAGMPPEVIARAFDPFFTTKGVGKGTGLGLSQVYGIAQQAGGVARIESHAGAGTIVRVLLPRTDAEPAPAIAADAEAAPGDRGARILVVDDDADVRRFLIDSLESLGFAVEVAVDGPDGLEALDRSCPDLMMLDYAMPGMSGAEMFRLARDRHPDLPIILASGYADTRAIEEAAGKGAAILRKPFRIGQLHAAIQDALGATLSAAGQ